MIAAMNDQQNTKTSSTKRKPARKHSAGLLLCRERPDGVEVLLAHPGGPFWHRKDAGAWSIPKGEIEADEGALAAARREFFEETGYRPQGEAHDLGEVRQPGGKIVRAWAIVTDWDPSALVSNAFEMEWPPKSGKRQSFPEIDRAEWFALAAAREKILKGQLPFLDRLDQLLSQRP